MKSLKTKLRLKKNDYKEIKQLSSYSKTLYNQTNYLVKQYFNYTGSYLNYNVMDLIMKERTNLDNEINYKKLPSGVSQQILKKLDKNWKSFFRSIKDWKKNPKKYKGMPRPPHYIKEDKYNLIYDCKRFQIKYNLIHLAKGININILNQLKNKTIKQIEIIPRYKFFEIVYVYVDDEKYEQISENNNVLGIDLGLNNIVTAVSNKIIPFIINGKPLKSINQYSNKKLGKIQTCLEKRNKTKSSNSLKKLFYKRNNKINDYLHKVSRLVTNKCVENKISTVIVGDVAKSLSNINLGKRNNQNFVNISLGQLVSKLKYKLENHNIKLQLTNESYTSKCSFLDNDKLPQKLSNVKGKYQFSGKRVKRGSYRTSNNVLINADVNGGYNIIRKVIRKFNVNSLKDLIEVDTEMCRWLHPIKLTI